MLNHNSQLPVALGRYFRREATLFELTNQLLDLFRPYFDEAYEDEENLIGDFLAAAYEVQDGVMEEETFRQAIDGFLAEVAVPTEAGLNLVYPVPLLRSLPLPNLPPYCLNPVPQGAQQHRRRRRGYVSVAYAQFQQLFRA